ncbi:sigma-54-dependent transcriptional regulator [Thermosulfurimonas dismutans]|uniref:Type IV fimbriae expression regulatory protein PilR n=1 Tax=Thermosulfurimonas dismutans TaxID=999894 RepID=A0A179D3H9_9BACT|nr:sigma-54 dependent transcriptional regulator [Thermosulfurimonas dismutans]OAQ20361.1 Type IV fimbriae expression regulatory protein PilR [Thermosulfurimonas dismutans]
MKRKEVDSGPEGDSLRILIVEDEKIHRELLRKTLEEEGYRVWSVPSAEKALPVLSQEEIDVAILDVRLPGMSGLELLERIKEKSPETEVLIITAFGEIEDAISAIKAGAFHYLVKPYEPEVLLNLVRRCGELVSLRRPREPGPLVYRSQVMKDLLRQAEIFARPEAPILILGESGVGKELLARYIHEKSGRKGRFVAVNCAALPEQLFEAELFGYERGAFTGAETSRSGLIEEAQGGTLFLDEIGEMPLVLQSKLLRFLQEGEFRRLGSNKILKSDARIIAATNEDLKAAVSRQKFREDLYFRLNVLVLKIPPLRERKEDIAELVAYFLRKFNQKYQKDVKITPEAMEELLRYSFPGNVRELENLIHRAVLVSGREITPEVLGLETKGESKIDLHLPLGKALPKVLADVEKLLLKEALEQTGYVQTRAAELLGIDEKSLRYKRKKYGI